MKIKKFATGGWPNQDEFFIDIECGSEFIAPKETKCFSDNERVALAISEAIKPINNAGGEVFCKITHTKFPTKPPAF